MSKSSDRKPTNTVLLLVGDSVVRRFEPTQSSEGKTTPAMRLAKKYLVEAMEAEDHPLHADLMAGNVEVVNAEVKNAGPTQKTVFTIS